MKNVPDKKIGWLGWLVLCVKGAIVGTGAILPGVSGGVLCVAFGVYEPMMALLSHPIKSFHLYYKMFIPFLLGCFAGFVLLAGAVEQLFTASSSVALMLFAGLIFGTVPDLLKKTEEKAKKQSWTPFVLALTVSFLFFRLLMQGESVSIEPTVLWYVFCGMVWGLSVIIPGLSSSSLLIYMGLYQPMTAGIAALDFAVMLPLVGGLLLTILLTARLVNRMFERRYTLVSRIVMGIMISSTLLILPSSFDTVASGILSFLCFGAGFLVARWMDVARIKQTSQTGQKE